jgi:phage virion morphogenesis protein
MIDVQLDNKQINEKLEKLFSLLDGKERERIFKKIGEIGAVAMERNFDYGGIKPNKWKENKPSTIAKKPKSSGVLVNAGNLRQISFEATQDYALIGSNQDYGKFHLPSKKSGHPSKNIMPVRDWLDFDQDGYKEIEEAIVEEIETALKEN